MNHRFTKAAFLALTLAVTAGLSGCDDANRTAKLAAAHDLKDPASAEFREIHNLQRITTVGGNLSLICGEVNSKNGYGAYGGFTPFFYVSAHALPKLTPEGAHAINVVGHALVADSDGVSSSEVKLACNSKDKLPLVSGRYDFGWANPCGGADGDEESNARVAFLATKRYGKDRVCETMAHANDQQPSIYSMSPPEREAYLQKLKGYLEIDKYIVEVAGDLKSQTDQDDALDKRRPKFTD